MKKNRYILYLFTLLFIGCNNLSQSQTKGSGKIISKTIDLSSFDEIELKNSTNVEIISGNTNTAVLTDFENLIQFISVKIVDNKLIIDTKPASAYISNSRASIKLTIAKPLGAINISGSGNIDFNADLKESSSISVAGSGNITAIKSIKCINLNASIAGSGNIDISKIETQTLKAEIAGSGNIDALVSKKLDANIAGSGNINYKGEAAVNKNIVGSGEVQKN